MSLRDILLMLFIAIAIALVAIEYTLLYTFIMAGTALIDVIALALSGLRFI